MANNDLVKSKSLYILKKKHQNTSDGTVFERDYMTLNSLGGWEGQSFPGSDGNFRIIETNHYSNKRKHKFSNWAKNENDSEFWTLPTADTKTDVSDESRIVLPNKHKTLLDFCYYGSCVELIKATVRDIILKFPASLYITNETFKPTSINDVTKPSNIPDGMVLVSNPFDINILDAMKGENQNSLRYFFESWRKYGVYDGLDKLVEDVSWEIPQKQVNKICITDGTLIYNIKISDNIYFQLWEYNGKIYLIAPKEYSGYNIRPYDNFINEELKKLDEFGQFMINIDSHKQYSMLIDYLHETERGVETYQKRFTWPTNGKWNLDIESDRFNRYLNSLIELASFYDEYYTNNLWRSLTHDAIKNLDRTFIGSNKDEDNEDFKIGTSKVEGLFWVYGRFFDEIKRYIDNIKNINTVTYSGENNLPNYFLTDTCELSGWDVTSAIKTLTETEKTDILYQGDKTLFTPNDANITFLKSLKINSKDILAKKGTRGGIEALFALFGLISEDYARNSIDEIIPDYKIEEFVAVASLDDEEMEVDLSGNTRFYNKVKEYNQLKTTFSIITEGDKDLLEANEISGLLVQRVKGINGENYLIPWFNREYQDGNLYFQMYGGWGLRTNVEIDLPDLTPYHVLYGNLYEETDKYLKVVENIESLFRIPNSQLLKDMVVYVTNLPSEYDDDASNYFGLYGYNSGEIAENGWQNISKTDIKNHSGLGWKVLYLESIIDSISGNNPHVGYGKYDLGEEYLKYYSQLFKSSIENNGFQDVAYDCETGELSEDIRNCGFNIEDKVDNVKCWFVKRTDSLNSKPIQALQEEIPVKIGKTENENLFYQSDVTPFKFEPLIDESGDTESESFSIINSKKMIITFYIEESLPEEFKKQRHKYITEVIYPYLKQMIPSTTIWEFRFGNANFIVDGVSKYKEKNFDNSIHIISAGSNKEIYDNKLGYTINNYGNSI